MLAQRKIEILRLVDRYNRDDSKEVPLSPFIARDLGVLDHVSERTGVPVGELNEFLTIINRELPYDYLMG